MLGERLVECIYTHTHIYIYIYVCVCVYVCVYVEALLLSGRASFVSLSSRLRRDAWGEVS